jgi:hypothetical protein
MEERCAKRERWKKMRMKQNSNRFIKDGFDGNEFDDLQSVTR